tara:strand:- start:53 stop:376 length:324 start_codon:yes stop_codon:yes gene_type:complete
VEQNAINALGSIEESLDCIARNLPETSRVDTGDLEAAILNGFSKLGPGLGGQWFDKSLENIDDHLNEIRVATDMQSEWIHDIHVSLRHLAELKAGRKLDGYWEDVDE